MAVECAGCSDPGPHQELSGSATAERLLCEACGSVFEIEAEPAEPAAGTVIS